MSRADTLAVNDKAVQDFVLDGEITEAEITAGAAQGRKWFSLRRLCFGFQASFTTNGYVVFPSWLGGLILQWGVSGAVAGNARVDIPFPLAFPNGVFAVCPSRQSVNVDGVRYPVAWTANKTTLTISVDDAGVDNVSYFAVGR